MLLMKDYEVFGFPGGSVVKNPPAMQETWVQSLDWKESLGGHGNPFQFLPGESHGQRSLASVHRAVKSRTQLKQFSIHVRRYIYVILLELLSETESQDQLQPPTYFQPLRRAKCLGVNHLIIDISDSELDFTHLIIQMLHFIKTAFEVGGGDSNFLKNMFWWKEKRKGEKEEMK